MARGFGTTLGVGSTDKVAPAWPGASTVQSFSIWLLRNGTGGGGAGIAFAINETNPTGAYTRIIYNTTAGNLGLQVGFVTSNDFCYSSGMNPTNKWLHVCGSVTTGTSGSEVIFVNGIQQSLTFFSTGSGGAGAQTGPLSIGNGTTNSRNWDGLLGDFAFWKGATLSQAEAMALYQGADPRTIESRYLAEYVTMRDGRPRSEIRASQPVTTGTRLRRDFAPVQTRTAGGWLSQALTTATARAYAWIFG